MDMYAYTHVPVCVYICVHIHVCVFMCTHSHPAGSVSPENPNPSSDRGHRIALCTT